MASPVLPPTTFAAFFFEKKPGVKYLSKAPCNHLATWILPCRNRSRNISARTRATLPLPRAPAGCGVRGRAALVPGGPLSGDSWGRRTPARPRTADGSSLPARPAPASRRLAQWLLLLPLPARPFHRP